MAGRWGTLLSHGRGRARAVSSDVGGPGGHSAQPAEPTRGRLAEGIRPGAARGALPGTGYEGAWQGRECCVSVWAEAAQVCTMGPLLRSVSTKKRKHSSIQDRGTEGQRRPGGCVWLWADPPRRSPDSPGLPPQPRGASSSVGCVRGTGPPGLGRTRPRERGGKQSQPQSRRRGAMKVVGRREAWAGQWLGQSQPGARPGPARPCGRCGVT